MTNTIKILSLDGGGSKGVFHLYFLEALERQLNQRTRNTFDYIGGTSVGGIISLVLTHPLLWMDNRNDFWVSDLNSKKIDEKLLSVVFGPPRSIFTPPRLGIFSPKYTDRAEHMQNFYDNEFFGKKNFGGNDVKPTMVFSYSLTENSTKIYKSWRPVNQTIPLSIVARATSAAPTFFPAVVHNGEVLIDGGVATNDPSYLMGHEARRNMRDFSHPLIIISLGTSIRGFADYSSCYNGGLTHWGLKFVNFSMETQQRIVSYLNGHSSNCSLFCDGCTQNHFHEILGSDQNCFADYHYYDNIHYFRFAPLVDSILDNTNPVLLNQLKKQAESFFNSNSQIVEKMKSLLTPQ